MSLLLVVAVGRDRPGLVSEVSEAIFDAGGNIEDMDQVVMREIFVMSILVSLKNPRKSSNKLRKLLRRKSEKTGLNIQVFRVEDFKVR
ncbi:MAG: ACT domain-containing protein [Candidatus Hecatellaceae archaeon]